MSEEKRQNSNGEEHGCDKKQTEKSEVGNSATNSDDAAQVRDLQQCVADVTDVIPSEVVMVEELPQMSLEESSDEDSQCTVFNEFLNGFERGNENCFSPACVERTDSIPSHKTPGVFNCSEFEILKANKNQEDERIEVFDTKLLNKEVPCGQLTAETSRDAERKRKKMLISSTQNKRYKEKESPFELMINFPRQTENITQASSGEFADIEDNVKDSSSDNTAKISSEDIAMSRFDEFANIEDNVKRSSSFDISYSNSETVTKAQMPLKDLPSNIQQRNGIEIESRNGRQLMMANLNGSAHTSQNSGSIEETGQSTSFASSLKGETLPAVKLSDESKKKFELSMATILEVPESENNEQIHQPMLSKTNPLKMKTKVGKRSDRCNVCNKKLGLCAIKCRCEGYFCAKHRYTTEHNCPFDYRSMGAKEIQKNNPRIVAEKIRKL